MTDFNKPYELTDAELDAVAAGAPLVAGGLVNVQLSDIDVTALNGLTVNVEDNIRDVANNNNVSVAAVIQALGGAAGIATRQR